MLVKVKLYSFLVIKSHCSGSLEILYFTRLVADEIENE